MSDCIHLRIAAALVFSVSTAFGLAEPGRPPGAVAACPALSVVPSREVADVSERLRFTANVTAEGVLGYEWSISSGRIVSGQGTREIEVEPGDLTSSDVLTATVRISGGAFPAGCPNYASERTMVVPKPKARLFDEIVTDGGGCEVSLAILDAFMLQMMRGGYSTERGIIVVNGNKKTPLAGLRRYMELRDYLRLKRIDQRQISVLRGPLKEDGKTQFWFIPIGADSPPDVAEALLGVPIEAPKEPYLYGGEYIGGVDGCFPKLFDPQSYVADLNADKGNRGRIIIGETSRPKFERRRKELRAYLSAGGAPVTRLSFVYKRVRRGGLWEFVEYWLIPPKSPQTK